MAVTIEGFDNLIRSFDRYTDGYKEMAKEAVETARPLSEAGMKSALSSAISGHATKGGRMSTGSLVGSVQATPVKENDLGFYSVTRPTGRNAHGERNGAVAAYLEYGTSKMAPSSWREASKNNCEAQVVKAMEDVINNKIEECFGDG